MFTLPTSSPTVSDSSTYIVTVSEYLLTAQMFQLNWKATDRSLSSTTVTSAASTLTTTTDSAGSNPITPYSSSAGLSNGAKAGLGVGISLGVFLLAGALAWYLVHRRRNGKNKMAVPTSRPAFPEASGTPIHEVEYVTPIHEVEDVASAPVWEFPGDDYRPNNAGYFSKS